MNCSTPLFQDFSQNQLSHNFKIFRIEDFFKTVNKNLLKKVHKIDFYTILIVTEDIGRHSINYKDFYYSRGTILATRKDQNHQFYFNEKVKGYILFFKEEFLNSYLNVKEIAETIQMFNELLTSPRTQLLEKKLKGFLKLVKNISKEFSEIADEYSLKNIRSYLHVLITKIHREKAKGLNRVKLSNNLAEFIKFQNLVEENYTSSKKVNFYAEKLGFSTKKLNGIVRFVTNKSVKEFLDDVVIIKAKREILHTELSIKQIAYNIGFKDPANFYKYFRKHTSFTPEMYRNRYKY